LPHKANITLGDETLRLEVSAIVDDGGYYIGPILWPGASLRLR
jgi:hypothetical protein